jgi:uncharacterized protein with ParB-like and HNH nuclease domain
LKTDKITVFDLFEKQRRYIVPIFQRGYVWNKELQWAPLWGDIINQADLIEKNKADEKITPKKHFLGAIVLSQLRTGIKEVQASEIIDGQQRLLTLQVFLAAFRDIIAELGDDYLTDKLSLLTNNQGKLANSIELFKVWPINAYHNELNDIMTCGSGNALELKYPRIKGSFGRIRPRPALVEAYLFFYDAINTYIINHVEDNSEPPNEITSDQKKERAANLYEAVIRDLHLVAIELEAEDDPQVIFETLNYRGVRLEPSDLIRNYIFLYAVKQKKDLAALYDQYWKGYDETGPAGKFWKEQERQGRFSRSRLDLFFFHYLTYRVGHEINMEHLYQEFKDWWNESSERLIEPELDTLNRSSKVFSTLFLIDDAPLGILAQRLRMLDTTTLYPFLLWLCEQRPKIDLDDFDGIVKDIESYIVRRSICRFTAKAYNKNFQTLISKLSKEATINRIVVQHELLALSGESAVWPDNEIFTQHLVYDPLYALLTQKRVRMILTALELGQRTAQQEKELVPVSLENSLTIEHIMPQGFIPEEWPYPECEVSELKKLETNPKDLDAKLQALKSRRSILLHSLGNLTLLTQPLNSGISNGPFHAKRPEITKQSLLILNSYFQRFSDNDTWDEDKILERGKLLAEMAIKVWGYPKV